MRTLHHPAGTGTVTPFLAASCEPLGHPSNTRGRELKRGAYRIYILALHGFATDRPASLGGARKHISRLGVRILRRMMIDKNSQVAGSSYSSLLFYT
jgi:hypothetical protein